MRSKILPAAILAGCVLLLGSCLDIDATMTLDDQGAGTVEFTYTVSPAAVELEKANPREAFLPFPIDEADFRRAVGSVPGLALKSYSRSVEAGSVVVKAAVSFADIPALNRLVGGGREVFALRREGESTVFSQTLAPGSPEARDPRAQEFLRAYFKPYTMRFLLTAPKPIRSSDPASAEVSGREARISYSLDSLVLTREPLLWKLVWR